MLYCTCCACFACCACCAGCTGCAGCAGLLACCDCLMCLLAALACLLCCAHFAMLCCARLLCFACSLALLACFASFASFRGAIHSSVGHLRFIWDEDHGLHLGGLGYPSAVLGAIWAWPGTLRSARCGREGSEAFSILSSPSLTAIEKAEQVSSRRLNPEPQSFFLQNV